MDELHCCNMNRWILNYSPIINSPGLLCYTIVLSRLCLSRMIIIIPIVQLQYLWIHSFLPTSNASGDMHSSLSRDATMLATMLALPWML